MTIILTKQKRISAVLAAVCVLLFGVIALPAGHVELPSPTPRATSPMSSSSASPALKSFRGKEMYSEINERPLFSPSRAFAHEAETSDQNAKSASAPPPDLLQAYTLVGVILSQGQSVALLKQKSGTTMKSLKVGEIFEGWSIARINENEVAFAAGEREYTVSFPRLLGTSVVPTRMPLSANDAPRAAP